MLSPHEYMYYPHGYRCHEKLDSSCEALLWHDVKYITKSWTLEMMWTVVSRHAKERRSLFSWGGWIDGEKWMTCCMRHQTKGASLSLIWQFKMWRSHWLCVYSTKSQNYITESAVLWGSSVFSDENKRSSLFASILLVEETEKIDKQLFGFHLCAPKKYGKTQQARINNTYKHTHGQLETIKKSKKHS